MQNNFPRFLRLTRPDGSGLLINLAALVCVESGATAALSTVYVASGNDVVVYAVRESIDQITAFVSTFKE